MVTTIEMVASRIGTLQRQSPIGTRILMPTVNSAISKRDLGDGLEQREFAQRMQLEHVECRRTEEEAHHQVDHRRAHGHAIEKPP